MRAPRRREAKRRKEEAGEREREASREREARPRRRGAEGTGGEQPPAGLGVQGGFAPPAEKNHRHEPALTPGGSTYRAESAVSRTTDSRRKEDGPNEGRHGQKARQAPTEKPQTEGARGLVQRRRTRPTERNHGPSRRSHGRGERDGAGLELLPKSPKPVRRMQLVRVGLGNLSSAGLRAKRLGKLPSLRQQLLHALTILTLTIGV